MTSDVGEAASVIARLGKGAASHGPRREEESGRPINRSGLPDPWLTIDGSGRSDDVRVQRDLRELGPAWLELDVWLARSLRPYAARNLSMVKTVRRDSM